MRRRAFSTFLILAAAIPYATGVSSVSDALFQLCGAVKSLLPAVSMLMVLVAATIYSLGQVMGAETRSRANVWATAALTGALIGIIIYAVAPSVLGVIYGGSVNCDTFSP